MLWRREMLAGAYEARWVNATARGKTVRALSFAARIDHDRYIGAWPIEEIARLIRTGEGFVGNTRSYFDLTVQTLRGLRIRDRGIDRLRRAVLAADALAGPKSASGLHAARTA